MQFFLMMANSLTAIADLLVPEDQRQKDEKKDDPPISYDDESEEFKMQMEQALKLSLGQNEDHNISNHSASSANKANRKKFRKLLPAAADEGGGGGCVEAKNKTNSCQLKSPSGGKMFSTQNLTELSYEEQLALAEARSKFDVDLAPSPEKIVTADEEAILQIAIQKSKDPSEQINRDYQYLLKALEESKREAGIFSEASSDSASTGSSSSMETVIAKKTTTPTRNRNKDYQMNQANNLASRRRFNSGEDDQNTIGCRQLDLPNPEFQQDQEDEDFQLAIKLSLGESNAAAYVSHLRNRNPSNNSYLAVAQKPPASTHIVDPPSITSPNKLLSSGRNVYADPSKVIRSQPVVKPCGQAGNRRRPIIIDGCNVAFQHGRNERFSAKGLLIVYQYFGRKFGYTDSEITIVSKYSKNMTPEENAIIESLYKINVLIYAPSRMAGRKLICSDDDLFILNLAKDTNGIVVSMDQYRDAYDATSDKELKDVIKNRLLQFAFKGDELHFATDPLGRGGPSLTEFLKY